MSGAWHPVVRAQPPGRSAWRRLLPGRTTGGGWSRRLLPGRAARGRWRRVLPDARPAGRRGDGREALRRKVLSAPPRAKMGAAAGLAAMLGLAVDGPMAGLTLAVYAALGVTFWSRWRVRKAEARCLRYAVDAVAALAAELRAGLPVGTAVAAAAPSLEGPDVAGAGAARVATRVAESIALAETSGAPLADVLDRLDTHLRGVDRARATAAAQAAGARASAGLLAAMPVAGVGLGYVIGADPLSVLLHTPLGAVCLAAATALQLAGLAWAARLSRVEVPS